MSNGKWVKAEDEHALTCEISFQNGGPKVYTQEGSGRNGGWKQRPIPVSAKKAIGLLWEGQTLYARRKVGGKYEWMKWEPAATAPQAVRMLTRQEIDAAWPGAAEVGWYTCVEAVIRKAFEVNALTIGEPAALPKEMSDAND